MRTAPSAPSGYRVRAQTVSKGTSEASFEEQTVLFDTSADGNPSLPGPAELLCAAFAACLLKNVERFSRILPFSYEEATALVTAWRQDSPPRFTRIHYELRLRSDEPDHRVDLLHRNLRKFGTVYNTLTAACEVDGTLAALPLSAAVEGLAHVKPDGQADGVGGAGPGHGPRSVRHPAP